MTPRVRGNNSYQNSSARRLDFDGDGRNDIVIPASSGQWITLDRNGDGESDLAFAEASASNAIKTGLHNGASTPPDLALSITDGWGVSAAALYVPITQSNYTKYATAVFPEMDFIGPAYVVSRATQTDGIGGTFYNDFHYFGARIHRQGRGFEGFEKTQSRDSRNGLYHLVNYKQAFPYTGVVAVDRVYQSDGTTLIAQTDNQYKVITVNDLGDTTGSKCLQTTPLLSDTRCFPYLDIATATSRELSPNTLIQTTVTNTDVDAWGNPTTVTTETTDNDPNSPFYNQLWRTVIVNTITNSTSGTPHTRAIEEYHPSRWVGGFRMDSCSPQRRPPLCLLTSGLQPSTNQPGARAMLLYQSRTGRNPRCQLILTSE